MSQSSDPDFLGWAPDEPLRWEPEVSISAAPAAPSDPPPDPVPDEVRPPAETALPPRRRTPSPARPAAPTTRPRQPAPPPPGGYRPPAGFRQPGGPATAAPAPRRRRARSLLLGPTLLAFLIALGFTLVTFFAPAEDVGSPMILLVSAAVTVVLGRLAWGMRPR